MTLPPLLSTPWWLREAPPDPVAAPLDRDLEADVAIVGGGYCGLWTALALRDRDPDMRIALVEAERCAHGPSGRNGGFLHGYWSALPSLRTVFGDEDGVALARASTGAVAAVRALGEDVWLREAGMLKVSAAPGQDASVSSSVAAAREVGAPEEAVGLSPGEVAERISSPALRAGVLFRDGATVQPARLARALRRAVLQSGAEIYERTPATRVRERSVETPNGAIRAGQVVLAVNSAATHWRPLARRLTNFGSYVVLTEPVPDLLREIRWTGGEAVVDGRMFLHYFRTTEDGRVLMGSGTGPVGRAFTDDVATAERAAAGLRRLLPALAEARIEHAWGGPVDVSADRFPFVGTARGIHYAAGFSGNGVGPAWLAAQALASLALGSDDEWKRLPLVNRRLHRSLPPEPLKRIGGAVVRRAIMAIEEAEEREEAGPAWARAAAAVPRLLGIRLGLR